MPKGCMACWSGSDLIHDVFTQGVELAGRLHGFSEEVSKVISGAHKGHLEFKGLDHVAYEEMAALHMLHAIMMFRVIGDITRTLRVRSQGSWSRLGVTEAATN